MSSVTELTHICHCLPSPGVSIEQEILNVRTTMCSRRCCQRSGTTQWMALAANPHPQRYLCICLCHFVGLFSQCHLWFVAVSLSFCQSVFLHPFFLLPLGLRPSFCTLGFCSPIVFQKKGKSCVGKGLICLISSSKMMEWVNPWACCPPALDPPLHHKSQENKLGFLS